MVQPKLCRITSPSLRTNLLVDTPTLAVCGAIGLPISAPTELMVGSSSGGELGGRAAHGRELAELGGGGVVAPGSPHADEAEAGGDDDHPAADPGNPLRERARHTGVVEHVGESEDEHADQAGAPHLRPGLREDL